MDQRIDLREQNCDLWEQNSHLTAQRIDLREPTDFMETKHPDAREYNATSRQTP